MKSRLLKWGLAVFGALVLASMLIPAVQGSRPAGEPVQPRVEAGGMYFRAMVLVVSGWASYMTQALPTVRVDRGAPVTALVCLALFIPGVHLFCRWLYAHQRATESSPAPRPAWRIDWSLCVVGIVLLLFVAGIAMVGLVHQSVWLAMSKQPGAEVHFEGPRVSNVYSLEWIGEATGNFPGYEDNAYPPGTSLDANGRPLHSWQTLILPHLGIRWRHTGLPDLEEPWDSPENRPKFAWPIPFYLNPDVRLSPDEAGRLAPDAPSHIAGNVHVLATGKGLAHLHVRDGLGQTILAGQIAGNFHPWGKPGTCRDPRLGINSAPNGFGSPAQGALMVMCDGSVRFFANGTDAKVLRALATPAGGEGPVSLPDRP